MSSASAASAAAASPALPPSLQSITEHSALFLVCDIQETFRGKIVGYESLIGTSVFLAKAAGILGIPLLTTEQKPFKPTVTELASLVSSAAGKDNRVFEKSLFSMLTDEVSSSLASFPARRHAVLFGIEAHVCVLQTALDLLRRGYCVHLVLDAVSSQNTIDKDVAIERLKLEAASGAAAQAGGALILTTAESLIFQILRDAKHDKFKQLVPAMKELAAIKKGGAAPSAAAASSKL